MIPLWFWVVGEGSEKDKNNSVKLGSWEVKLFWKLKFLTTFMRVNDIYKIVFIHNINLWKILNMNYFEKNVTEKVRQMMLRLELAKWR